jgi:hypothetical protein
MLWRTFFELQVHAGEPNVVLNCHAAGRRLAICDVSPHYPGPRRIIAMRNKRGGHLGFLAHFISPYSFIARTQRLLREVGVRIRGNMYGLMLQLVFYHSATVRRRIILLLMIKVLLLWAELSDFPLLGPMDHD